MDIKLSHRAGHLSSVKVLRMALIGVLVLALTACAAPAAPAPVLPTLILITQDPNASPTTTPFQPSVLFETPPAGFALAPLDTATATIPPTSSATPTAIPSTPTTAPAAKTESPTSASAALPARSSYILYSNLDFYARTLTSKQTIRYTNTTGTTLSEIVLAVFPNQYDGAFILNSISQDGIGLSAYSLEGERLTVSLPQALPAGSSATFALDFQLNIPQKASDSVFGYDINQINLVDWYPFIVPYQNGWILYEPMPWGEHLIYDSSDIELNIKADPGVVIAAGATPDQNDEWSRYRLYGARTFALSASDEFLVSESSVGNVVVRSYYFSGYQTGGSGILVLGSEAIQTFSEQFSPYPHQTLSIIQTDMHDGMEYDGLVFLASDFYSQYTGGSRGNLATIGVHEIAHQWWYGLVGSDYAMQPWLDEAMSVYSERIFYENNYPSNISWWWQYRVDYFKPSGYVDSTIYDSGSFSAYTNAVYLRGAHFLDDLRERMGDGFFSKFLKEYARRYAYQRATSANFFALARETVNVEFSDLLATYFMGSY